MKVAVKATLKTITYGLAKLLAILFLWPYFRISVKGRSRIPRKGAVVVAANHFSFIDPLLLGMAMPRRVWFAMSRAVFETPGIRLVTRLLDVIPVSQGEAFLPSSARKILTVLHKGGCLGIFPEGGRSRTGTLLEAQPGAGLFARRAKAPLVPVAIAGTREAWPAGLLLPRPKKVHLFVGEPIPWDAEPTAEALAARVRRELEALLMANGYGDYVAGEEKP